MIAYLMCISLSPSPISLLAPSDFALAEDLLVSPSTMLFHRSANFGSFWNEGEPRSAARIAASNSTLVPSVRLTAISLLHDTTQCKQLEKATCLPRLGKRTYAIAVTITYALSLLNRHIVQVTHPAVLTSALRRVQSKHRQFST